MLLRRLYYTLKMQVTQYNPIKDIKRAQLKRLQHIITHAYRTTEFYHEKFKKAGIHPSDIQSLKDLKKIPFTTKDEVIKNREKIIARGYSEENTHLVTTSGSSGRMLKILQNARAVEANEAAVTRAYIAMGTRMFRDRTAYIRHMSTKSVEEYQGSLVNFLVDHFRDSLWIPVYLDEDAIIRKIKDYNPTIIAGYPSSLYVVAKRMKERNITVNPRFVMSGGELLTQENRSFLREVFRCDIFDFYGAYELLVVGWECSHHGMHTDDMNILEFIKDGKETAPGEPGEVVGTNLWYKAMPFIRYKLGDIASAREETCTCGRNLPLMNVVEGRRDDFLLLPSGKLVGPRAVKPLVMMFPEVDKLQIVQEKKDVLVVRIVEKVEFTRTEELKKKIKEVLKEDITVNVDIVDDIPLTSGKLRAVFSKVVS